MAQWGSQKWHSSSRRSWPESFRTIFLYTCIINLRTSYSIIWFGQARVSLASHLAACAWCTIYLVCHRLILCSDDKPRLAQTASILFGTEWDIWLHRLIIAHHQSINLHLCGNFA